MSITWGQFKDFVDKSLQGQTDDIDKIEIDWVDFAYEYSVEWLDVNVDTENNSLTIS